MVPRARRTILISLIAAASLAGLLVVIENAPLAWQFRLTPSYRGWWMPRMQRFAVEEAEDKMRRKWFEEYRDLSKKIQNEDEEVWSEKDQRFFPPVFIRAELLRTGRELKEFRATRKQWRESSYLRYLWSRLFPSEPEGRDAAPK